MSWAYEGQPIVENQDFNYRKMTTLPENASILFLVPMSSDRAEIVKSMDSTEDIYLSISNIEVIN
ncbi:hypothetical protein ACEN4P_12130 [Marinilactibacillus psychrotolerans]|uniref:Uncharacterized protein n=1 Tax=Marinilactibacillus psychrotolerans TaxID=191770 RepID=A0A5R9C8B1_9LACT|nr:hypothetical protein [Marinilactibacillus psychrotolerans]TLQ09454.1 hypothetical protein FEZ48_01510 [Marinilactibacillus psychrotolerans]